MSSGAVSLTRMDRDADVYGRKLRNIAADGRDVGDVLVSEGRLKHRAQVSDCAGNREAARRDDLSPSPG